jgi:uncharacterized membrane protein YGL010W
MARGSPNPFFIEQMAMYSAYHRDRRNRATHFIGIPLIVFALLVIFARVKLTDAVSLGMVLFAATAIFYLWLDRSLGAAMALVNLVLLAAAEGVAAQGRETAWIVFWIAFVAGWIFQLAGHAFEGRRPALTQNLLQALIGPMFLVAETAFALGAFRAMHDSVEARWPSYRTGGEARTGA